VRRRRGDQASWERLEHWPLLQKEALRKQPEAFVAEDAPRRTLYPEHTSGTSGKPLQVWHGREALRRWYALAELRNYRWNGISRRDRWAMIGGQLVTPFAQARPPFWVWNHGMRQLYLSSYHLTLRHVRAYVEAMRRHRVRYLLGYASSLHALARLAREEGVEVPRLAAVVSNAEPFYPSQREVIADVFGCPTRDTYGMTELVASASECAAGRLHLWPEVGRIEVWRDYAPEAVAAGQAGRLVCTGLLNEAMPLVRYEVGDRGALDAAPGPCACGRSLPVLQSIEGRLDDVILTRDGRQVGRLDPIFKADLPIREAQIIQETLDRVRVRFVPAPGYRAEHGTLIVRRLCDRVGGVEVALEPVEAIPRSANGKLRAVISKVRLEPGALAPRGDGSDRPAA
jgi:phenylacetate-CoA ligase